MLYSQCFANKCLIHTHIPVSIYVYTHTHTHTHICIHLYLYIYVLLGLPKWFSGKDSTCQAGNSGSILGLEVPLEKELATHSSVLVWKSHGQRSLVGYSIRSRKESDITEQLSHHCVYYFTDIKNI